MTGLQRKTGAPKGREVGRGQMAKGLVDLTLDPRAMGAIESFYARE